MKSWFIKLIKNATYKGINIFIRLISDTALSGEGGYRWVGYICEVAGSKLINLDCPIAGVIFNIDLNNTPKMFYFIYEM